MQTAHLKIGSDWQESENGKTITLNSPWDLNPFAQIQAASSKQATLAIDMAANSFLTWRKTSLSARLEIFEKIIARLIQSKDELAQVLSKEIGKFPKDAESEINRSIGYIKLVMQALAQQTGRLYYGDITGQYESMRKTGLYTREPLGVILAISSFNYPINLSITKIAPAILAGNTVVFKPATQGSYSATAFYSKFFEAGLPDGVLNIVTGSSSEIGDVLITDERIKLIAFTGSTGVGRHIGKISTGIPLLLELGGKDAAIVTNNADIEVATSEIVSGGFSYCGQRCTAQKIVIAYDGIADKLRDKLVEKSVLLDLNPMIDEASADYIGELITDATEKGAHLALSGQRSKNHWQASIIDKISPEMRIFSEEQFGPVLPIIRVKDEQEAIKIHAELKYGLQASVYSQDIDEAFRISSKLEVGTVQINARTDRGPDNFPFGGVNDSGQFMQGTIETLELMTRGKLTVVNLHNLD